MNRRDTEPGAEVGDVEVGDVEVGNAKRGDWGSNNTFVSMA